MKDLRFLHKENKIKVPKEKENLVREFRKKGTGFNEKHKEVRENKSFYNKFRERSNPNTWSIFKDNFLELTDFRCPICEEKVNKYHDIDHYRPKNHYWWLAYDYRNYMVYCELCNRTYKKENFPLHINQKVSYNKRNRTNFKNKNKIITEKPLIFNPNFDNPAKLFEIEFKVSTSRAGFVEIKPLKSLKRDSYSYAKANETIKLFNLDNKNAEIKKTDKLSRQSNMESNWAYLKNLAKLKNKYIENPNKKNKSNYLAELEELSKLTAKNGLIKLIVKGNFEIPAFS